LEFNANKTAIAQLELELSLAGWDGRIRQVRYSPTSPDNLGRGQAAETEVDPTWGVEKYERKKLTIRWSGKEKGTNVNKAC
jgi:hypothetical protein